MSKKDESPNIVQGQSFEEMMKSLNKGPEENEDLIQSLGDTLAEKEAEVLHLPKFNEGDAVLIEGIGADGKPLVIRGKMRGLAPIITPFGPAGHDLIIEIDNAEKLPTTTGETYPFTCITAPLEACKVPEDDKENSDD